MLRAVKPKNKGQTLPLYLQSQEGLNSPPHQLINCSLIPYYMMRSIMRRLSSSQSSAQSCSPEDALSCSYPKQHYVSSLPPALGAPLSSFPPPFFFFLLTPSSLLPSICCPPQGCTHPNTVVINALLCCHSCYIHCWLHPALHSIAEGL